MSQPAATDMALEYPAKTIHQTGDLSVFRTGMIQEP